MTCPLCSTLADQMHGRQKYGWPEHDVDLPPAVGQLVVQKDLRPGAERKRQILGCPSCGTCYLLETDYEYQANGTEDEQHLTRLSPEQAAELLSAKPP